MRHLDLFSGIVGSTLADERLGIETVQFVEIDPYAQKVLWFFWRRGFAIAGKI
ncbi:MAG: DNA cytosine methyltransferase [Cyanobacteria bacterium P01_H01_bin.15]